MKKEYPADAFGAGRDHHRHGQPGEAIRSRQRSLDICDLLAAGGQFDGFGVGTHFAVSRHAPSISIVYKLAQYDGRPSHKTTPDKAMLLGRKTLHEPAGYPVEFVGFPGD